MAVERPEEIEETRLRHDVAGAKERLKALDYPERAYIMRWLLVYFEDSGASRSPQIGKPRRRVTIDGEDFWLVKVPRRKP